MVYTVFYMSVKAGELNIDFTWDLSFFHLSNAEPSISSESVSYSTFFFSQCFCLSPPQIMRDLLDSPDSNLMWKVACPQGTAKSMTGGNMIMYGNIGYYELTPFDYVMLFW